MQKHRGILAVDFDNTIARVPNFPVIEGLIPFAIGVLTRLKLNGWFIIINTCRSGDREKEAIDFLKREGVPFDLINENHPGLVKVFGADCRKISADVYIDDKNSSFVNNGIDWVKAFRSVLDFEEKNESMLQLCKEIES